MQFPLQGFPFDDYPSRTNVRSYLDDLASRHPEFADQLKEPPWSEDFVSPSFRPPKSSVPSETDRGSVSGENSHGRNPNLNHFGLRNTVPLGQNANQEEQRRQRSMSAPPDGRAADKPRRFVSKCEIPIMHDPEELAKPPAGPPPPEQPKQGNAPNVRLIPIQVEGRDEPIINADVDSSANFPSDKFQVPFEGRLPRDFGSYQRHSPRFAHKERAPPTQQQPQPEPVPTAYPMPMPAPADETDSKPAEPPPEPVPAKDPLSKVESIQKEVEELKHQVEAFDGRSRSDKQFLMLDELLTRKLISLDDIDTEGKEDVRQARKDTIRSIQRCISLLESRIPAVGSSEGRDENSGVLVPVGSMEVDTIKDNSVDPKTETSRNNSQQDIASGSDQGKVA